MVAAKPASLAADFEAFGDWILENRRMDPDVNARWERFIAGERPVPSLVPLAATHT